jgi:hypothetical protein
MMENFEDDVLQVKSALERLGRFDFASRPEPHGYVTKELDGSVREYQRDRGLENRWLDAPRRRNRAQPVPRNAG